MSDERLEELRKKRDEIEREVCLIHNIQSVKNVPQEKRAAVTLEWKRRIFDLIEKENRALSHERSNGADSVAFNRFVGESANWYAHLGKRDRIDFLEEILQTGPVKGAPASGQSAVRQSGGVQVKKGDSLWSIIERTLLSRSDFTTLDEAQKSYVLAAATNLFIEKKNAYGMRGEQVAVGDKLNISIFLQDEANQINSAISKAIKLGQPQKDALLKNKRLIENWLALHGNERLDLSGVADILSPKKEVALKPDTPAQVEIENEMKKEAPNEIGGPSRAELHEEIALARASGKPKPESSPAISGQNDTSESILPDHRSMMGDFLDHQRVEEAFRSDLDQIYGKKKLFSRVSGVESDEWNGVKAMTAKKFIEFFTRDSSESDLDARVKAQLTETPEHRKMASHLNELTNHVAGKVKPFENETLEDFVKRLGSFIMRSNE